MIAGNVAGFTGLLSGNTIYVDAVNGNNSTGTRGRLDLPFKDPVASTLATGITSGDIIQVGPGTYNISFKTGYGAIEGSLILPTGVSLIGSGPSSTTISSLQNQIVVQPGGNCSISNMTITGNMSQTQYSYPIGVTASGGSVPNNVIVRNIVTNGWSDGVVITDSSDSYTVYWSFYNCTFNSNYDAVQIQAGGGSSIFDFYNCIFNCVGVNSTTNLTLRGISCGGVTVKVFGGLISCTPQNSSNCSGIQTEGIILDAAANIYLYGTVIIIGTNGGTSYSLNAGAGLTTNWYVGPGTSFDTNLINGGNLISTGSPAIPVTSSPVSSAPAGVLGSLAFYSGNLFLCTNEATPTWIGLSGYSGYSGISGYSGYSGKSGYSGYSG
jgi:hypothetical protein